MIFLSESTLTTFFSFLRLEVISSVAWFLTLTGVKLKDDQTLFFSLPFLKAGMTFPFFQIPHFFKDNQE